ncbi:MAG: cellulase family glycosylhydrolase [Bacteroidales bacterium]|nr:cellulase family glycosylhydrolase [Bacteroidales bacterium]
MKNFVFLMILMALIACHSENPSGRIDYNGRHVFLNGANIAWIDFAKDIGPGETDFDGFKNIFSEANSLGANCMRLWLHTDGTNTPEFDSSVVKGPGIDAIADLSHILDLAYSENIGLILCLWSFDMLRKKNGPLVNNRNKGILTVDSIMDTYIGNALIPMVDSLKDHPGIIAWEVFNEPEGMCHDIKWGGWEFNDHVSIKNVQRFINKCAAAIHKTKPELKVTNGTWSLISATDADSFHNYYTDERLIEAGGEQLGILDFYTLHHYDWMSVSPFEKPIGHWGWDKPVVLAEFFPGCKNCGGFSNYENLYQKGYAGAMGWDWHSGSTAKIKEEIAYLYNNYASDIQIKKK